MIVSDESIRDIIRYLRESSELSLVRLQMVTGVSVSTQLRFEAGETDTTFAKVLALLNFHGYEIKVEPTDEMPEVILCNGGVTEETFDILHDGGVPVTYDKILRALSHYRGDPDEMSEYGGC